MIIEPWDGQPTDVDGEFYGLTCKIIMHDGSKHYCGYVAVPKEHPAHGKHYDAVDISVHGGLTFGDKNYWDEESDDDKWYFGFDCAHFNDATAWSPFGIWRGLEYVKHECESMAKQLNELMPKLLE